MLDFLKKEEKRQQELSLYKPDGKPEIYKCFDGIVGTSTGAILSVALGRLNMTPTILADEMELAAKVIFPPKTWYNVLHSTKVGLAYLRKNSFVYKPNKLEYYLPFAVGCSLGFFGACFPRAWFCAFFFSFLFFAASDGMVIFL